MYLAITLDIFLFANGVESFFKYINRQWFETELGTSGSQWLNNSATKKYSFV